LATPERRAFLAAARRARMFTPDLSFERKKTVMIAFP
jgi:hypothetical protein